jgi:hypothetical protein
MRPSEIKLEFRSVDFYGGIEEKTLEARKRINNKLYSYDQVRESNSGHSVER